MFSMLRSNGVLSSFETHVRSLKGKQVCSHHMSDVASALVRKLRVLHIIRPGATASLTVFRFLNDVMLRDLCRSVSVISV
jgi:hypothetical protein